jgi:putative intracellular protease/amidase
MARVLMVISGADSLTLAGEAAHPTGYWAEEVVTSHRVLHDAGVAVDIATPGGVRPTVDSLSLDERGGVDRAAAEEFRAYLDSLSDHLARPLSLGDMSVADYDAIFVPGGHAPMEDLARDADLGRLLTDANRSGTIIAALCHGPAGLLSARGDDAGFIFAGRRLTVFTDEEERQGGLKDVVPYLVESRLRELGAVVEAGPAWTSQVVVDGNLITGQNPQSSVDTAQQVIAELRTRRLLSDEEP